MNNCFDEYPGSDDDEDESADQGERRDFSLEVFLHLDLVSEELAHEVS